MAQHRSRHDKQNTDESIMEASMQNKEGNVSQSAKGKKFEYIPVAKSDQRSALSSIQLSIESIKASEKQKDMSRGRTRRRQSEDEENDTSFKKSKPNAENVGMEDDVDVMLNQLERTKQNLQERFNHLTSQLEAAEYSKVLKRNVIPRAESESDDSSSSSEEESVSSAEEDVENEEWDEKELLDEEALSRAKSMRCKVREASNRICRVREELTGRITSLTEEEVGKDATVTEDENTTCCDDDEVTDSEDSTRMNEMAQTLRQMSRTAKYVNDNLPGKIEVLQETINTIERSVDKLQKQADAFDREGEKHLESLPSTERAILSRLNEGRKNRVPAEGDVDEKKENVRHTEISPEKRFALYLLQG